MVCVISTVVFVTAELVKLVLNKLLVLNDKVTGVLFVDLKIKPLEYQAT